MSADFTKDEISNLESDEETSSKTNQIVEYDELLSAAGEFGVYQIVLCFCTFPFYVFGVFVYFSQIFMTEVSPNHWCWIPELANLTELERRTLAIPTDTRTHFGYSQCSAYKANWTDVLMTGTIPDESWDTIPCQHGWEFNKSEIPYPTISSELGWVCDKNSYQASAQAIFSIGSIIGGFVVGWISDRFGRLSAIIISNILGCIGGLTSTFTTGFVGFAICRFIMGMAFDSCMMMAFLLVLEYCAPKYRTILPNVSFAFFYALAATSLPWIALACGNWKIISLVTSLPLALTIFTPLFIPESPRWLLSKGRIEETVEKVLTIARMNKKVIPVKLIEQFKCCAIIANKQHSESSAELLRRPLLRKKFIYTCLLYMCCALVFDGLVRSVKQLDFNYFLSFSLVSLTELPSMILIAFIMDWFGRRWLITILMAVSCVFSMFTIFVGSGFITVIFAMIARFAVNMSFGTATQWAPEMMPVSVRGSAVSIVHICGYVGTMLSPYVVYLETFKFWLPMVVIGCVAGLGSAIALILPETANKDMPETFEDAENLIKTSTFWEMPCLSKDKEEN